MGKAEPLGNTPQVRQIVGGYLKKARDRFEGKWENPTKNNAKLDEFQLLRTLGSGTFGRVMLIQHSKTKKYFALKMQDKDQIHKQGQTEHIINEKTILQAVAGFPFIVEFAYSFQDNSNVYLVLEVISGGDMFSYLRKVGKFSEPHSKIYACQVILAFEYLHGLNILYRDLKPENVLINPDGYLKVTDLGFAKRVKKRTWTMCGTPNYIAPEIILNKGYGVSVDWWTLGVLIYEMASGLTPFEGDQHMDIYEKIVGGNYRNPSHFSSDLKDLLAHIIQVDLTCRFGNLVGGVNDIKNHAWLGDVNWVGLYEKRLKPPYVPVTKAAGDVSAFRAVKEEPITIRSTDKYGAEFAAF